MKKLLAMGMTGLVALLAGCAQQQNAASPMLNSVCIVTGEPIDADSPTVDYMGGKIAFCCDKCLGKWNMMDATQKKAAFDARK